MLSSVSAASITRTDLSARPAIKHPTPVENLYGSLLNRLAARGEVAKPNGGFEAYLKENFKPKTGDAYSTVSSLRSVGKLQHEESSLLVDYFGLKFHGGSTKAQIAKRNGVSVSAITRSIADAEDKLLANPEMIAWLRERHPEAWPED